MPPNTELSVNVAHMGTVRNWLAKLTMPRYGTVGGWFSHKAEYLHKAMREWGDGTDMYDVARRIDPNIEWAVISQSGHVIKDGWVTPGKESAIVAAWLKELNRVIRSAK